MGSTLRRTLALPYHVATLFSTAKSFRDHPLIGSPRLNKYGLYVARVVLARGFYLVRQWPLRWWVDAQDRAALRTHGFVVKPQVLPPELFAALQAEVLTYRGESRYCVQGNTITWRAMLDETLRMQLPAHRAAMEHPAIRPLMKYAAARNEQPLWYIQKIWNGVRPAKADPQKNLHADTFHPTIKAWLFLHEVKQGEGPFTYVPGSHRLSRGRLRWEHQQSQRAGKLRDGYSEKGSLRISEAELTACGLAAPVSLAVQPNTLVIADTRGFHRRGDVDGPCSRLELWAYTRFNPFSLLPGLDAAWVRKLRDRMIDKTLRATDRAYAEKGKAPPWRLLHDGSVHELPEA